MAQIYYCALIVRHATGVVESKNWASGIFLWMASGWRGVHGTGPIIAFLAQRPGLRLFHTVRMA